MQIYSLVKANKPIKPTYISNDTAANIFSVTLQDHVIKGSSGFMGEGSSFYIPTLPKVIAKDTVLMDI